MEPEEKLFWAICCMLITVFVVSGVAGVYYGYSEGTRTGDIYKFSQKGWIYKSWEGEMYLGGIHNNGNNNLELDKFYFSIPESETRQKQELIDKLNDCVDNRRICRIQYTEWAAHPITVSSGYIVTNVTVVDKER